MQSKSLIAAARSILKDLLEECTPEQRGMFRRMYAFKKDNLSIGEVVDQMDTGKLDWAICQCERTLEKKK